MQVHGTEAMAREARRCAASLARLRDRARVVALSGPIGAGKTTFTQGIATALGIEDRVTSPTFVIERVYPLAGQPFERLIHIDAYRLHDAHELEALGWKELIADPGHLILIEWPEHVGPLIPEDAVRIALAGSGDSREIIYG